MAECVFGNYLIQMFFERGMDHDQERMLTNFVYTSVLRLSQHNLGCRLMQKVLATVSMKHKIALISRF